MAVVTTDMIKMLRERTGAGIMDCKNALIKAESSLVKCLKNESCSLNIFFKL